MQNGTKSKPYAKIHSLFKLLFNQSEFFCSLVNIFNDIENIWTHEFSSNNDTFFRSRRFKISKSYHSSNNLSFMAGDRCFYIDSFDISITWISSFFPHFFHGSQGRLKGKRRSHNKSNESVIVSSDLLRHRIRSFNNVVSVK